MRPINKSSFAAACGRRLAGVTAPIDDRSEIVVPLSPLVMTLLRTAQVAAAVATDEFIARAIVREAEFVGLPTLADARQIAKATQAPDRDGSAVTSPDPLAAEPTLFGRNAKAFADDGELVAVPDFPRVPFNRFASGP